MARSLVFSDNFDWHVSGVADLHTASIDWELNNSSSAAFYRVDSQKAKLSSDSGSRRNVQVTGQTFTNDQYCKITISDGSLSTANFGLGLRAQAQTTTENLYRFVLDTNGTGIKLAKYDGGTSSDFVSDTITAPTVPFTMSFEVEGNILRGYINDVEVISHTDAGNTFTTGVPGLHAFQAALDVRYDNFESGDITAASGPLLDPVPTTAFPGQSRTVTGTGFGATQGTGGVTIGGVAQTITAWGDTSVTFTTVLGTNSYGTGKTIELTADGGLSDTDVIELVADTAGGFGEVTMSNPNTTDESSVCFGATPTVVTGDQFEWEDFNTLGNLVIDAQGFVESVDTEGVFRGRFWDDTDDTWGTVEEFNAQLPDVVGPVVSSVSVPSAATYAIGQDLDFTVNWDEVVTVTGAPQLQLTIGSNTRQADFVSGSGTQATLFTYTIVEGDLDTNGIVVDSLGLNGGTIVDAASNAATLTLNNIGSTATSFPQATTLTQGFPTAATTHPVALPATVVDGDLLLIQFTCFEDALDVTIPTGFTSISNGNAAPGVSSHIVAKVGEASDSGQVATFTLAIAGSASSVSYKITDWSGSLSDIEVSAQGPAGGDAPDCPSLSATWGSLNNLWLVFLGAGDDDGTIVTYPTGFTNGVSQVSGAGVNAGNTSATARKEDQVKVLAPSTFSLSESESSRTFTVVVRPHGVLVDGVKPILTVDNLSTTDTSPTVQGTVDDNETSLTLTVNAVQYFPTPTAGTWSQQLNELALDTYPMTLDGTDAAGNAAVQVQGTLVITDNVFEKVTGNMHIIRLASEAGINTGSINLREIKYWQSLGATSSQYNEAQHQAQELS